MGPVYIIVPKTAQKQVNRPTIAIRSFNSVDEIKNAVVEIVIQTEELTKLVIKTKKSTILTGALCITFAYSYVTLIFISEKQNKSFEYFRKLSHQSDIKFTLC